MQFRSQFLGPEIPLFESLDKNLTPKTLNPKPSGPLGSARASKMQHATAGELMMLGSEATLHPRGLLRFFQLL